MWIGTVLLLRNYTRRLSGVIYWITVAILYFVIQFESYNNSRYKLSEDTSREIAKVVWDEIGTKDVRNAIQLSRPLDNTNDVGIVRLP